MNSANIGTQCSMVCVCLPMFTHTPMYHLLRISCDHSNTHIHTDSDSVRIVFTQCHLSASVLYVWISHNLHTTKMTTSTHATRSCNDIDHKYRVSCVCVCVHTASIIIIIALKTHTQQLGCVLCDAAWDARLRSSETAVWPRATLVQCISRTCRDLQRRSCRPSSACRQAFNHKCTVIGISAGGQAQWTQQIDVNWVSEGLPTRIIIKSPVRNGNISVFCNNNTI